MVVFHQPIWKILARQIGSFPQVVRGENSKKHIWNHQPEAPNYWTLLLTINHIQSVQIIRFKRLRKILGLWHEVFFKSKTRPFRCRIILASGSIEVDHRNLALIIRPWDVCQFLVGGFSPTHLKNMLVKMGIFPKFRGEHETYLKAPPRFVVKLILVLSFLAGRVDDIFANFTLGKERPSSLGVELAHRRCWYVSLICFFGFWIFFFGG